MSPKYVEDALNYVDSADLPEPRSGRRGSPESKTVLDALDTTRQQAAVVGSEVVAFAEGVPGVFRQNLANSTLLAQLVATKKVPDKARIFDWYDAYFDALANIGWTVQERNFAVYVESGQNFEAHKAIIAVLSMAFGPGATAVAMLTGTLEALQSMDADSPWITLFSKESMAADTATFQVSAVEKGPDGEPFVTLAAFGLHATKDLTQVLFFKARASDVTLRHCSSKIAIDAAVAAAVQQPLRDKLAAHAVDFVKTLPDL
ncbi:hypothetical protein QTI17_31170 [Variovorax sp. J31P179]|uniref:hypothetical protein n=1 Tax=Variovorax sp. J31P179 TaxID=3053508 RepID=UPI0025762890|nr:hypothetical protein [Variovorax sp. J31P179]MDM0085059.1 hypothetical protein [Variovorax sp. J31P179]